MTNARRFTMLGLLLCGVLVLAANSWAQQRAPILDQIAKTYGIDSWDKVDAIRYTWNGEITGLFKAAHKWEWEPKTNKVSYEGTDKDGKPVKVTYIRSDLSTQSDAVKNEIDPSFINDNYWVLFPFHAYWDKSASVIDQGKFNLPVGPGIGRAGPGEVSRGWRLHARRHLGSLRRQRQPRRVLCLPPRRRQTAEPRPRNVGRLQKGRSNSVLDRASRHRRWQAPAHFYF